MYGIVSAMATLALFFPATYWVSNVVGTFFGGFNVFVYYGNNFVSFFLLEVGTGIILGAVSSYLAVRRYLRA
jgi:hypothetical protein